MLLIVVLIYLFVLIINLYILELTRTSKLMKQERSPQTRKNDDADTFNAFFAVSNKVLMGARRNNFIFQVSLLNNDHLIEQTFHFSRMNGDAIAIKIYYCFCLKSKLIIF